MKPPRLRRPDRLSVAFAFVFASELAFAPAPRAQEKNLMAAPEKEAVSGKLPAAPPTPPEAATRTFRVLDGFRMELLAAEPLVASPVAMAYDEDGRAYVCEMRDYPYTDKARHKPGQENPTDEPIGRVRLLVDGDGDGVFDRATPFAEDLSWPTGVACWKGGVFVAATPDLWYLKDTDGDGRADVRERVLTGFRKLNVQAVMNNLVWGLDNHIHGAGGSNGGAIRPAEKPDAAPVAMARADFRIDPASREFELLAGGARFGGSFDDWGNRFLCNIRNPAQHIVLPARYLSRNALLAAPPSVHDMAESGDQLPVHPISPPEPWRVVRARRWAGERDIHMPRSELVGAGVVTSASGITRYRGGAYPAAYRDSVFVAESAGNLLYRLRLSPDGVTFQASRAEEKAEMVASTDNWFRPVNFCNAPDGTLHVLDMYRENIEHPWSIPEDIHAAVDLEAGRDMGRIWRLAPPGFAPDRPPRLGGASVAELVAALEHPHAWWRETAQRLLFERRDAAAAPALRTLLRSSPSALARLHALWTLEGLGALEPQDLLAGLKDSAAGVREHSVRLAEPRLDLPPLLDAVLPLAHDEDARVRFQAAFTLGETKDARALAALAAIAKRDAADPWIRTAVLSSVPAAGGRLLAMLLEDSAFSSQGEAAGLLRELARLVGARGQRDEMREALASRAQAAPDDPVLRAVASGIGEGLKRSGKSLRGAGLDGAAALVAEGLLDGAARIAADAARPVEERAAAASLLAYDDFPVASAPLAALLDTSQPQEVQIAAVRALATFTTPEAVPPLLARWRTQTPAVRAEVVAAMTGARARALPLLEAVEGGLVPASQIPFAQRRLLLLHSDARVKELAAKHFASSAPGPRGEAIANYRAALDRKGDPARGRLVFEAACVACHRAGDLGAQEIGPNLATVRAWNPEQILINTLDPNREVAPAFLAYTVETRDGRSVYGMIAAESAASLTLKRPDGASETLLRRDIAAIDGAGVSLMPEGLEAAIPPDRMADLIAFLLAPAP